jgi:hypothetical protein
MRGLPSTIVLVLIAAGLLGYIYFVDAPAPTPPRDKVFAVTAADIDEITVTTSDATTVLRKATDTWRLTSPVDADADEMEVSSLTSQIAGLEITRSVDEQAADLAQYGLDPAHVTVGFRAGDTSGRLLLGDTTPTSADMYAVREGERHVFLIPAFLRNTFDRSPFDLRDKRILRVTRADIDAVEIGEGPRGIRLARVDGDWRLERPYAARADAGVIEGLVTRLVSASMASIEREAADALAPYGLDRPALVVQVAAGSGRAILQIGREENGRAYARDASRPMVFTIDRALVDDLNRAAEDYRNRDIFTFRTFNAERLTVTRGGERTTFEKRPTDDGQGPPVWQRIDGPDTHASLIEDLLSKLASLRAQSFSGTTTGTGLGAPLLVVETVYDEGRTEQVSFGRSANEVFAARDDEPGAARLDNSAFDEALEAVVVATTGSTDTSTGSSR